MGFMSLEIHCKLQKLCYTLQSRAAAYSDFKAVRAGVTRCSMSCYLSHNIGKKNPLQVAKVMLHTTIWICNLHLFQYSPCWCYTMQYVLLLVSQYWKKKSIASCRSHVTRCNLELQLAVVSKQSVLVLHGAVCLATCLTVLEKEIHCKLQKSCYTLQSRAATCSGFKTVRADVTQCNMSCYLSHNIGKRNPLQVAKVMLHTAI